MELKLGHSGGGGDPYGDVDGRHSSNDADGFEPRNVEIGADQGDTVEIGQGLAEGEQVVASGQFLIDSEASLRSGRLAGCNALSTGGDSGMDGAAAIAYAREGPERRNQRPARCQGRLTIKASNWLCPSD